MWLKKGLNFQIISQFQNIFYLQYLFINIISSLSLTRFFFFLLSSSPPPTLSPHSLCNHVLPHGQFSPLSFSLRHCCCDHGLFDFFFFLLQSFKRVTRLHASICWTHKLMDPRRRPKGDCLRYEFVLLKFDLILMIFVLWFLGLNSERGLR